MHSILAPCKINLGLHVLRVRADGFRDIDTVFLRIPWCDQVTWTAASARTMSNSDPALPTDGSNLCMAAAAAFTKAVGVEEGFHLHLDKRVPYGAGLGSGSSDAAAVLRMMSSVYGARSELPRLAADLGSDVPFFLGPPVARGTGRGEVLTPLDGYKCPFALVVAVPQVHVPTGPAYALVSSSGRPRPDLVAAVRSNDLDRWRAELTNEFQEPVEREWPAIGAARRRLAHLGADYAAMSGSGSAVFGVFESESQAMAGAQALAAEGCRTWTGFPDR
jgi:4-diphosphocytidyl-2-C-methyl-D-erythritol kinase